MRGLSPLSPHFDVIVVGAGAAGMMCAIEAGRRGRSVTVIERNDAFGKKIRISGGGRCNFTNIHTAPENFICGNKHFHKSVLAGYTPSDFIALVERHRIRYHEKKLGQLFCDGTSDEILNMLRKEAEKAKAQVRTNCSVTSIRRKDGFLIETNNERLTCKSLVIATGGLSIPRIGATSFGHAVAKQFGLRVTELRPGLVPLLAGPWPELSGVSLDANVSLRATSFHENILFTHRGLSGPAILQISSYWKPGETISIHPLPPLPRRFSQIWKDPEWKLTPTGTEGYAKAEVTVGGVDTDELSSQTMEARRVPGLYFIGEVVDVTGHLGGFNFQWAWASGFAAGQAA
jgi:predicted Rossmann fold flavoprotein